MTNPHMRGTGAAVLLADAATALVDAVKIMADALARLEKQDREIARLRSFQVRARPSSSP